jgi:hypothetical protein
MTIAIEFTKKINAGPTVNEGIDRGCIRLSSGTIVAMPTTIAEDRQCEVWRSQDDGLNWTQGATLPDVETYHARRALTLPGNILLIGTTNEDTNTIKIYKSTDEGESFAEVFSATGAGDPDKDQLEIHAMRGYKGNQGVMVGHLRTSAEGAKSDVAICDDTGEDWDLGPEIIAGNPSSAIISLAVTPGGLWQAGNNGRVNSAIPYAAEGHIHLTDDYGENWTLSNALPKPSDGKLITVRTICALTNQIILAGGEGFSSADKYFAWLWRSTDGGVNWTAIDKGVIAQWPSTDARPIIEEIERLTKDAAILGFGPTLPGGVSPYRFSIDAGLTWGGIAGPAMSHGRVSGAICSSFAGTLCSVANEDVSGEPRASIYRGILTC